jgi:hypothetical protein
LEFLPFAFMAFGGWLAGGGHQIVMPLITNFISGVFGQRQKRVEAQASVATKQAVSGDVAFEHIFERMERLEARVEEQGRVIASQGKVVGAYDNLTRLVRNLVQQFRRHGKVSDDLLEELEKVPSSVELMK